MSHIELMFRFPVSTCCHGESADARGPDVSFVFLVQDEIFLNGTIVLPHKEIKDSQLEAGTIIM